jgi:hypothetical protein
MEEASRNVIQLAFPFSLWDRVKAALVLIPQRRANLVIHSIIPLIGIAFFIPVAMKGRVSAVAFLILLVCLLITPLFTVIAVAIPYVSSPMMREPFTYSFDDSGIHVHAGTYNYTHKWHAISQVKRAGGFMLFFFGPGTAHCLPLAAIRRANAEESLLDLARKHGASTP